MLFYGVKSFNIRSTIPKFHSYMSSDDATHETQSINPIHSKILNQERLVTWESSVKSVVKVTESSRSVEEYMALPASQYSVLTAQQIIRLSDHQFKCVIGNLNFFGNIICPILYVDVNVYPEEARSEIVVVRAETTGSDIADKINGTFDISAVNSVSAGIDSNGKKILTSDTKLKIDAVIPRSLIPLNVIRKTGNFIIKTSLKILVATFVRILAADFSRWSKGDNKRDAVPGAELTV